MRSSAVVLALMGLGLGAATPVAADWLVLIGGKRIRTEGPWTLKGDLLTVHETSGRILAVATHIVDAQACLAANGGVLRIQAIPGALPQGTPLSKPRIAPAPAGDPAAPAGLAKPASPATPAPSAGSAPRAGSAAPAPPAGTGAGKAQPAPAAAGAETGRAAAAKRARQAQLLRELRYREIVEGCSRMFVIDRAGFQRCLQIQTQGH
jgi:hypothetical protein